jgi:hypothetical protein
MSKAIQQRLMDCLQVRGTWEQRQKLWYEMLHDGVPRRAKPFAGAANLHLPIADNAVQKWLPYYCNSVFSRKQLASFTPLGGQLAAATTAASECLDWKLRKESNFPVVWARAVYLFCATGRALIKCRWDSEARGGKGRLDFEAIDPLYFIGDATADTPQEMDVSAHVKQYSVAAYKRSKFFKQDAGLIERIRGGENQAASWKEQEKEAREGLTSSSNKDMIVLWETYERVDEGFLIRTFSPSCPEEPVRDPFLSPLSWQGEPLHPCVAFAVEIAESGWYAPRGIPEKVAAFEAYGTKMWNEKADWLAFSNKPLFERDPQAVLQNTANIGLKPGDVLPPGVKPVAIPAPPFGMDQEMNMARELAEETAQVPDFGTTQDGDQKSSRTATEMQYIGSFSAQGIQHKAWVSGIYEAEVYKRAWALLLANSSEEIAFFTSSTRQVLPQQSLTDNYLIEPDALPDSWNKQERIQREFARFSLLRNDPRINQDALYSRFLSAEDPRLAKELYLPANLKAASEAEDEAIEIGILLEGFPAAVMPGEDHQKRLQMLFGKLEQLSMMPPPQTPEEMTRMMIGRQRMQEHIAAHVKALQQENPALAKQFMAAIGALEGGAPAGPAQAEPMSMGAAPQESVPLPDGGDLMGGELSGLPGLPGLQAGPAAAGGVM